MAEMKNRIVVHRLYPNSAQEKLMLLHCRYAGEMFNYLLGYCKDVRKTEPVFPSAFDMINAARLYRKVNSWMEPAYANCLNMVAKNLKKAINNYFDRKKCGLKAGFPRYKSENRMDSFSYPDRFRFASPKDGLNSLRFIKLPKIGFVKCRNDLRLPGRMMTATVFRKRYGTRYSWYVRIQYELEEYQYREENLNGIIKEPVGIDMGLVTRVAFSDGEKVGADSFYRDIEEKIARESRKLERIPKCLVAYEKQLGKIGRIYKKAHNLTWDKNHKLSREIVFRNSIVVLESLQPEIMINRAYTKERRKLFRDASWSNLTRLIQYKAEDAGTVVSFVNPANTSQMCSHCGTIVAKDESERIHKCPQCGFVEDRDVNAARNILQQWLGSANHGSYPESLKMWQSECTVMAGI